MPPSLNSPTISWSAYPHLNCSGHAAALSARPGKSGAGVSLCDIHRHDFRVQSQFSRGGLFGFPAMG
jgi:hypothetical protein